VDDMRAFVSVIAQTPLRDRPGWMCNSRASALRRDWQDLSRCPSSTASSTKPSTGRGRDTSAPIVQDCPVCGASVRAVVDFQNEAELLELRKVTEELVGMPREAIESSAAAPPACNGSGVHTFDPPVGAHEASQTEPCPYCQGAVSLQEESGRWHG
jgi:endogenous inhibitor of DNA gyrase (YacG/DUF329 family)